MTTPAPTIELLLPEGFSLVTAPDGDTVTLVNRHRDGGDIFALGFLTVVVLLFASGIGDRVFGLPGMLGALAVTSPLWGWLALSTLRRAFNRTTVVATPGTLSIRVGPISKAGSAELATDEVGSIQSKHFENRSSTRGGKLLITKTWSVWVHVKNGKELCLAEPLDTEAQARAIERKLDAALRARKGT